MINNIFYIGLYDKDIKKQIIKEENAIQILHNIFVKYGYDCLTVNYCYGIYKHINGDKVKEPSFKIEILTNENIEDIEEIIKDIKEEMNQEAIGYFKQNLEGGFF